MKLVRFGPRGEERPGLLVAGKRRDASRLVEDYDSAFFRSGGLAKLASDVGDRAHELPLVPDGERWGACVARPGKVVCIGLNYRDHAREAGLQAPREPILFLKAANAVVGPYDDVLIPR